MQHKLLLRSFAHKFQSDTSMQMCASRHIMSQAIYILRRLLVGFVYVIEASMFAPLKGHLFWTSVQQDFLNAAWLWFYDWDELTHLSLQNIVFQQVPTVILGFSFHSPTSGFQRFYLPEVAAAYNGTEYVQACLILQRVIWEYTALCWIQPFSLQHLQRPNGLFRSTCWWKLSLKFYCTRDVNEVLNFMEYLRGKRSQAIHRSKVMVVKLLNQRLAIFILLSHGEMYIFSLLPKSCCHTKWVQVARTLKFTIASNYGDFNHLPAAPSVRFIRWIIHSWDGRAESLCARICRHAFLNV